MSRHFIHTLSTPFFVPRLRVTVRTHLDRESVRLPMMTAFLAVERSDFIFFFIPIFRLHGFWEI